MTVTVLCANFGGYDEPATPPRQTVDAEWYYLTDQPFTSDVWTVIQVPGVSDPRLAAKWPKCRPELYTSADVTVWLDASARLLDERSLEHLLWWSNGAPIAQFAHFERDCLFDEAQAAAHRDPGTIAQAQAYAMAHPPHWGLWATGVIVRNRPLPLFGALWLAEVVRWSSRDQVAQPYVLRHLGLRPHSFPAAQYDNEVVRFEPHLVAS